MIDPEWVCLNHLFLSSAPCSGLYVCAILSRPFIFSRSQVSVSRPSNSSAECALICLFLVTWPSVQSGINWHDYSYFLTHEAGGVEGLRIKTGSFLFSVVTWPSCVKFSEYSVSWSSSIQCASVTSCTVVSSKKKTTPPSKSVPSCLAASLSWQISLKRTEGHHSQEGRLTSMTTRA